MTSKATARWGATSAGAPRAACATCAQAAQVAGRAEWRRHVLRFAVIGTCSGAADLPVYYLLTAGLGLPVAVGKGVGYLAGTLVGFVGNKLWTFESPRRGPAEAASYLLLYAVSLLINVGVNAGVLAWLGAGWTLAAFVAAAGVTTVVNFLGSRLLVFRKGIQQRRRAAPAVGRRMAA
jgi:putative flippase GtrA